MKPVLPALCLALAMAQGVGAWAQPADAAPAPALATGIERWLLRLHEAQQQQAYIGTFVVSAGNQMSSSRIWHVGDGRQQLERVESLTGAARTVFRHDKLVVTFLPERKTVIRETRDALGLFPNLLNHADASVTRLYRIRMLEPDRVAGLPADRVMLTPRDPDRYGYQIWTEQKTGLMVKLQTLGPQGEVMEQAAFSELQLNAPVQAHKLAAQMDNTLGYAVYSPQLAQTTAQQEGWQLGPVLPGFAPVSCYRRQDVGRSEPSPSLQCVFSDGLASVSLFVERFDAQRHGRLLRQFPLAVGATHLFVRQLGEWCLTVVGEVPAQSLMQFAQALERKP